MTNTETTQRGRTLASRSFSTGDQSAFAAFSGDRNPVHVDPLAARRTLPGQCIVHGMHTLLWALDSLVRHEGRRAGRIRVRFLKPIFLEEEICCLWSPERARITVTRGEIVLATIQLFGSPVPTSGMLPSAPAKAAPSAPSFAECSAMQDRPFCFHGDPTQAQAMFPDFVRAYGMALACEIGALSYLVGMQCPGQNSLFSALSLEIAPSDGSSRFGVLVSDDRFRFFRIAAQGPAARAEIEAFHVPTVSSRPVTELASTVTPGEFAGVTALVVGGSRGLGAVTARLIAAGGGTPIVTYNVGAREARDLCDEIRAAGCACEIRQLTVAPDTVFPTDLPRIDQMHFFATPKIFGKRDRQFHPELKESFCDIYVHGFAALCAGLSHGRHPVSVLYPSTVAIDEALPELVEYAAAKLEGERLCAQLNSDGPLTILMPRLPRIKTDQTLALQDTSADDPVALLLPLLRRMTPRGGKTEAASLSGRD